MQEVLGSIRKVRFTQSTLRQANIREKGPSLGKIQVKIPHQGSPYAMKFGDPSHQKTERQQGKAWNLPKTHKISKKRTKLHPSRPRTEASATTATGQAFAQPELRRVLVAVPPSRRKPAGGYGTISRTPLWSFGGQGRKPANVGVHTETRTMEISPAKSVRRYEKSGHVNRSWSELAP